MFEPEKVLQNMGIVFPCHLLLQGKGMMEISMTFPWVWRLSVQLGDNVCYTHPLKLPYLDTCRVKVDQLTWGEGYGRTIDLSEGQGHIPYMEIHVLLRVKIDHLITLTPDTVSFILISTLHEATTNLYQSLFRPIIFLNLLKI